MGRERPILFSGAMVRAILDGKKAQTRRVVKFTSANGPGSGTPSEHYTSSARIDRYNGQFGATFVGPHGGDVFVRCPYGQPGDTLWVRETWTLSNAADDEPEALYRADPFFDGMGPGDFAWKWSPSIHMPRWASRLSLEVTAVRVEPLDEISESDARKEGAEPVLVNPDAADERDQYSFTHGFIALWDSINEKRGFGWDVNPWVWVVEFQPKGR